MAGADRWPRLLPLRALRPPGGPRSVVLVVVPPIQPVDIAGLCDKVRRLLADTVVEVVTCDVGAIVRPDLVVVDALARMQLAARQVGRSIRLRHAGAELLALLGLVGLDEVLPLCPAHHAVRQDRRAGLGTVPEPG